MQTHAQQPEFMHRLSGHAVKKSANHVTSEELDLHIAEFEQRGGIIKKIPTGTSSLTPGTVIVGEEPESMCTPRPSKANAKKSSKAAGDQQFVNLKEAAEIIGISTTAITRMVQKGELVVTGKREKSNEKLVHRDAVIALKLTTKKRRSK